MFNIKAWLNKQTNDNSYLQKDIDPQDLEKNVNEQVDQSIRQLWIIDSMQKKLPQFSTKEEKKIFCGSWNVNNKKLDNKIEKNEQAPGLHKWLLPENKPVCDIYAIGFQEIVDLNAVNVVLDHRNATEMTSYWQHQIECVLNENNTGSKFSLVAKECLVGMLLFVFVKITVRQIIKDIRTTNCGVGILGILGNKGSVAIRFKVNDTSFCFVNTHLRASQNQVIGRNEDFHMLLDKTIFPTLYKDNELYKINRPSNQWSTSDYYLDKKISNHDYIYWVGDLNYRIDTNEELTKDKLFEYSSNQYHLLRDQDQLNKERKLGHVFEKFNEGELNFPPTYKYVPGTDTYHPPTDKKVRTPAWCDRILWKINSVYGEDSIRQLFYDRIGSLLSSDHKPVYSIFTCDVLTAIEEKERIIYQELMTTIDKWENARSPKVNIEGRMIQIDDVITQNIPHKSIMVIENIGTTPCSWSFVPKMEEKDVCPKWLTFNPNHGILGPNEKHTISVTININLLTANDFISNDTKIIDEIVVLRVINGSDFFCIISGTNIKLLNDEKEKEEDNESEHSNQITDDFSNIVDNMNTNYFSEISYTNNPLSIVNNSMISSSSSTIIEKSEIIEIKTIVNEPELPLSSYKDNDLNVIIENPMKNKLTISNIDNDNNQLILPNITDKIEEEEFEKEIELEINYDDIYSKKKE